MTLRVHNAVRLLPAVLAAGAALLSGCGASSPSKPVAAAPIVAPVTTALTTTTPRSVAPKPGRAKPARSTTTTTSHVSGGGHVKPAPAPATPANTHKRTAAGGPKQTESAGGERSSAAGSTAAARHRREVAAKAAYIRYADGICASYRDQVVALDKTSSGADPIARARQVHDLFGVALGRLRSRARPRLDADLIGRYLSLLDQQKQILGDLADAAARNDTKTVTAKRADVFSVSVKARLKANAYGLEVCGT